MNLTYSGEFCNFSQSVGISEFNAQYPFQKHENSPRKNPDSGVFDVV